jgi:hypothetical protein
MGGKKGKDARKSVVKCPKCNQDIDEEGNSLMCEFCETWVCGPCSRVPQAVYDVLNATPDTQNFLWVCDNCKGDIPSLTSMKQALETNTKTVKRKIDKALGSEEIKKLVAGEVEKVIDDRLLEKDDRMQRETNLMVFKMRELNDPDSKKRQEHDENKFNDLCRNVLEVGDIEVRKIFRIGKRDDNRTS